MASGSCTVNECRILAQNNMKAIGRNYYKPEDAVRIRQHGWDNRIEYLRQSNLVEDGIAVAAVCNCVFHLGVQPPNLFLGVRYSSATWWAEREKITDVCALLVPF